jgi:serine protease 56
LTFLSIFVTTLLFLGALNTVGRYIVNMTRGGQEASITNNNPSENIPDAILTLTKNVLGQNVTKTIEPMIKRIGVVETRDDPALLSTIAPNEFLLNATSATFEMVDAKKKKQKKQKTKRKDQPAEQPAEQLQQQEQQRVELFSAESRKIPIF